YRPLNRVVTYSYDNLGNLVQLTNPAEETTSTSFDALGRASGITNPLGHVTSFTYDAAGRLTGVIAPNGGTTGYKYDTFGRITEKTAPDGRKQTYAYRTDNLLSSTTDPKSQTMSYTYDAGKRLTQENAAGLVTSYSYSARNQLTSATNPSGAVSAVFNDAGRLAQETNNGKIIQYTYNTEGERSSFTGLGSTTNYAYDNRGLLSSLTSPSGLFSFTYDLNGRSTSIKYPNNDIINYQYNAASQLTGINSAGIVNTNYGYERDAVGRITRWTGDNSDWFYQYDVTGRLLRADHGQENFGYTYDPLGNILDNGRTHDITNRLLQDNEYTYSYDLNGNLTKKQNKATGARTVYSWNARNQLTRVDRYLDAVVITPDKSYTFAYDSFGRRVSKTENGITDLYVHNGSDQIGIIDSAGNLLTSFTYGPYIDEPLGMSRSGVNYYFHTNHIGSVMVLTTISNTVSQYGYDPYGKTHINGDSANRFRYTAREQDADDLYYYRSRYYDPTTYRFLNEDIAGLKGGLNVYAYVQNNPINLIDPYGLWAIYIGLSGSGGYGVGGTGGFGFIFDSSGNYGTYGTYGGGVTTPGASGGVSVGFFGSVGNNTTTISDYGGPFVNGSAGIGAGVYGGIDGFFDPKNPSNFGGGVTVGAGTPGPGGSINYTKTSVCEKGNIYNDLLQLENAIKRLYGVPY
ncbi:MAG: RHS repeat-associated core domain-containing protein, partial [Pedobacter sp.]